MLKLIIKLPREADASILMPTAIALAHYKSKYHYKFRDGEYDGSIVDYSGHDLNLFELEPVWDTVSNDRLEEYELNADVLDPYLMERLAELQKIIPFEMYFENRGKYDAAEWMWKNPDWLGDIYDNALDSLFWQERLA